MSIFMLMQHEHEHEHEHEHGQRWKWIKALHNFDTGYWQKGLLRYLTYIHVGLCAL
jgi:hypothetical protein